MAELREELQTIELDGVETYINSGNIFFESAGSKAELVDLLGHFFCDHYPFIQSFFSLGDEIIHRGNLGIYWGKYSEETYTKTAYHRQVLKMPDYRLLTIRNANTFDKIGQFLRKS